MPRARRTKSDSARPLTAAELQAYAVAYLARFDCTVARLRQVLQRKQQAARGTSSAQQDDTQGSCPASDDASDVESILVRFQELGYLDDQRFARGLARGLLAKGTAPRRAIERLKQRGVAAGLAGEVVGELAADGETELAAACRLVRRKRLGWHRPEGVRRERAQKDLAALARAGFSFDVARRALIAPVEEEG